MFRTQTGQTGKEAYQYELAALRNSKRALERQMTHLIEVIKSELSLDATSTHQLGESGPHVPIEYDTIIRMLDFNLDSVDSVSLDLMQELIDNLQVGEAK